MSLCKHCVSGVRHVGEPTGEVKAIGGVQCYVATPQVDYPKDKAILFLTDVFGIDLINSKLLADDFALNGFKVIAPDLFNGDPLSADAFNPDSGIDFMGWLGKHMPDTAQPLVNDVIKDLKTQGITKFATIGYCYGARIGFNLAFSGESAATVANHPSFLKTPDDLITYAKTSVPLLINSAEIDEYFPAESLPEVDKILGNFTPGYERKHWKGCTHGFSVRGDLSDENVKAGKEGAFKAAVDFLIAKF